ncbi:hypothetical protein [Trichormus azollae]|uniref:hypothetical protein n=1 Tax=Trichormus azollae TaxID=1164 RepID=UPI00325F3AE4
MNYGIAVTFELPPGFQIPASKKLFYKNVVPKLIDALGNGSVTKAWFDFQAANTATAGNKLFTVDAPLGGKLYSVVAGKSAQECPLENEDTQIAFLQMQLKHQRRLKNWIHKAILSIFLQ